MWNIFLTGFLGAMEFLLTVLGGAAAVVICTAAVCLAGNILAWGFDRITTRMAKGWKKKGKKPKGRIGTVILRSIRDHGEV